MGMVRPVAVPLWEPALSAIELAISDFVKLAERLERWGCA